MANAKSFVFLILLFTCSVYSYWLSNKDYEWVVPFISDRSPAAVRTSDDVQKILEKPMRVFKYETVVASINIATKNGHKFFQMGQFPVPAGTNPNLVCLEYPYIKLKFLGEGVAINGERPVAWLQAACQVSEKNQDFMSDIHLPFDHLDRWQPKNQEVDFSEANLLPVKVRFEKLFGKWPALWQLESVEFSRDAGGVRGDNSEQKIIFSNYDFLKKLGAPVIVK